LPPRGLSLNVEWIRLSSGAPINVAPLSESLEFAGGGVGPLLTLWAKTQGNLKVRGVAAINDMPMWLNSSNPSVRSIRDLPKANRIALPAVKVSVQAVVLQMAARQRSGGQQGAIGPPDRVHEPSGRNAGLSRRALADHHSFHLAAVHVPEVWAREGAYDLGQYGPQDGSHTSLRALDKVCSVPV
jgi:hypothetical protein